MVRKSGRAGDMPAVTYTFSFQAQYANKPGMLARIQRSTAFTSWIWAGHFASPASRYSVATQT